MAKAKNEKLSLEDMLERALVKDGEKPYEVPKNWAWTRIEYINNFTGKSVDPSKEKEKIFELYSVPSCDNNFPEIIYGNEIGSTKQKVSKEDVLLCKINPRINRVWMVSQRTEHELIASSEWIVISNNILNSKYLMWCLKSKYFREYLLSNVSGVGGSLMRAQPKFVKEYPVPIPPIIEQQRIVDVIESLFEKLDTAKELAQNALDSFENRKSAILHKAFTGELTAKWREENGVRFDSWQVRSVETLGEVKGGKRLPKGESLVNENTGFPYIKAGDLKNGTVLTNKLQFVTEDIQKIIKNYTVKTGDVYITIVGACIGDVGIVPEEVNGANLTENAAKITNLTCDSRYLGICLGTVNVQKQIKDKISSATLGKLSLLNIKSLVVQMPTIQEQKEIVRIIDNLLENEQRAKELCDVIEKIDLMKKAILARAFRGELGTNDPEEESAVELLKEVLKEKI